MCETSEIRKAFAAALDGVLKSGSDGRDFRRRLEAIHPDLIDQRRIQDVSLNAAFGFCDYYFDALTNDFDRLGGVGMPVDQAREKLNLIITEFSHGRDILDPAILTEYLAFRGPTRRGCLWLFCFGAATLHLVTSIYHFFWSVLVSFLVVSSSAAAAGEYRIVDLGTLPGYEISIPVAISESGSVTGYAYHRVGSGLYDITPWIWANGRMEALTGLPLGEVTLTGMDPAGRVVGYVSSISNATGIRDTGFRWQDGVVSVLPTLGGMNARPSSINSKGEIIGWSDDDTGSHHQVVWRGSDVSTISVAAPYNNFGIDRMNSTGSFTGGQWNSPGQKPAPFVSVNGTYYNLDSSLSVRDLNDRDEIVGVLQGLYGDSAFRWTKGGLEILPSGAKWSYALAINNQGAIAGAAGDSIWSLRPLFWDGGPQWLPMASTDTDGHAVDINDSGWITGFVDTDSSGYRRAVLWTPVPEPSTFLSLAVLIASVFVKNTRRSNK